MESREYLFELIKKKGCDRQTYLMDLFKYVPEGTVKEMELKIVHKNEAVISAGDPSDYIYFMIHGQVVGLDYHQTGYVYSFMDFTKMNILGDFEAFGDVSNYDITLWAVEDCVLIRLSKNSYLNWVRHDENALFLRIRDIVSTLSLERKGDREYIHMNCKDRLVMYLINSYKKSSNHERIKIKKTQAELADKIGFNVRSIQRNIAALEDEGFITVESGKITVSKAQYALLEEYILNK